jgi:leucyl-tRNA synthetase
MGILSLAHRTLRKVTEDIESFRFNTAVPALMILANELSDYAANEPREETMAEVLRLLILMLSPMAPHLAHEVWEQLGYGDMLATEAWPEWDPELVAEKKATLVIQVDGRVRDRIEVSAEITAADAEELALSSQKVRDFLEGRTVRRVISRPPDVVNLVVG